jgi:hypothetical protein
MQYSKPPPPPILYVCNPNTYVSGTGYDLRQAMLYCTVCSTRVSITSENLKTTGYRADSVEKLTLEHSSIYGGQCLRTECRRMSDAEIWNTWKTMCSKK